MDPHQLEAIAAAIRGERPARTRSRLRRAGCGRERAAALVAAAWHDTLSIRERLVPPQVLVGLALMLIPPLLIGAVALWPVLANAGAGRAFGAAPILFLLGFGLIVLGRHGDSSHGRHRSLSSISSEIATRRR